MSASLLLDSLATACEHGEWPGHHGSIASTALGDNVHVLVFACVYSHGGTRVNFRWILDM